MLITQSLANNQHTQKASQSTFTITYPVATGWHAVWLKIGAGCASENDVAERYVHHWLLLTAFQHNKLQALDE